MLSPFRLCLPNRAQSLGKIHTIQTHLGGMEKSSSPLTPQQIVPKSLINNMVSPSSAQILSVSSTVQLKNA